MDLTGMVAVGEYSDACICSKNGKNVSSTAIAGAITAACAGVVTHIEREKVRRFNAFITFLNALIELPILIFLIVASV
jgi:hypothetical protein